MSDAIRELRNYLAKSPSVVYPEDVLTYLPAIEAENAKLQASNEVIAEDHAALCEQKARLLIDNTRLQDIVTNDELHMQQMQDEIIRLQEVVTDGEMHAREILAESTKLRELVRRYGEYINQDRCEGCVVKSRCNDGEVEECWQLTEIHELACEMGVEV